MHQAPIKRLITIDDIDKLDVRVSLILHVNEVTGSDKLMKLIVDFGCHQRTILAGIRKERLDPTEIKGLQALFILNLPPREIAGEVSEGMLLDIGYADGITPVLTIAEKPVPNGARMG